MLTLASFGYLDAMALALGIIMLALCIVVSIKICATAISGKPPPFFRGEDEESDSLQE